MKLWCRNQIYMLVALHVSYSKSGIKIIYGIQQKRNFLKQHNFTRRIPDDESEMETGLRKTLFYSVRGIPVRRVLLSKNSELLKVKIPNAQSECYCICGNQDAILSLHRKDNQVVYQLIVEKKFQYRFRIVKNRSVCIRDTTACNLQLISAHL
jgi:hypothetical protein